MPYTLPYALYPALTCHTLPKLRTVETSVYVLLFNARLPSCLACVAPYPSLLALAGLSRIIFRSLRPVHKLPTSSTVAWRESLEAGG